MANPPSFKANILVVDDTIENLRLLASMLGQQGYEVRPVTNGPQALLAAERDPPDLILLDINMPDMNGYEVCQRLKERDDLKEVPVIFLTALNEIADKVKAFDVGGIDYITKPFQLEEVNARVKTHVQLTRTSHELRQSLSQLRALERLRDDLVHMVVHDMRSPLMVMLGHLSLLEEDVGPGLNEAQAADLKAVVTAARSLNRMANDLLDVSRLEQGKLPLTQATHDLAQIAEDVRNAISVLDRTRRIGGEARGDVAISCDGGLVRRVLENLVSNAVKHTPDGGDIQVSVERVKDRVRFCVEDEGPGVPLEAREKIFQKFESSSTHAGQKYHSAGLGLAFCKLAVEAHGGRIGVDSREPRGSTFWFEIPA